MNKNNLQIMIHQTPQLEQALELSVQSLIKSWLRRQKLKSLFLISSSREQITTSPSPWRTKLVDFLESKRARALAISLLLLDLILTTLELTTSLVSCHPSNKTERQQEREQETPWYHWLGIAILGLLLAKTTVLAAALGPSSFFRTKPGLVVDGVVLAGALVMETFLEKRGGGLLVVVSLWRVVRVLESAFELSDDAIEAQIEGVVTQFERLKEENRRLSEVVEKIQEDLDQCREKDYCSCLEHV